MRRGSFVLRSFYRARIRSRVRAVAFVFKIDRSGHGREPRRVRQYRLICLSLGMADMVLVEKHRVSWRVRGARGVAPNLVRIRNGGVDRGWRSAVFRERVGTLAGFVIYADSFDVKVAAVPARHIRHVFRRCGLSGRRPSRLLALFRAKRGELRRSRFLGCCVKGSLAWRYARTVDLVLNFAYRRECGGKPLVER